MIYDSNDIRNQDWFNRLMSKVGETQNASIRAAGAEADDPYFAAVGNQSRGDLSNARADAFRHQNDAAWGSYAANAARNKAKQSAEWAAQRAAVAGDPQRNGSATYLGVQGPDAPAGQTTDVPAAAGGYSPAPAPEAYRGPGAGFGGAVPQRSAAPYRPQNAVPQGYGALPTAPQQVSAYNPARFQSDALEKQRLAKERELQDLMFQLNNTAPMGRVNPYVEALKLGGRR